jgi:hypothetical protein
MDTWAQFTIKAQLRARGEWRRGYKTLPVEDSEALLMVGQRSRLIFHYKNEKLETKLAMQDARIWGESKWKTDNEDMGLYEGWAKYQFTEKFGIKVGRQQIVYDDGRLFASGNWRTYAQAIDAALFMFTTKKTTVHIGLAANNNSSAETAAFLLDYELEPKPQYKNFIYLWFNHKFDDKGSNVSFLALQDGFQRAVEVNDGVEINYIGEINYRYTLGPYLKWKTDLATLEGAYYQQMGVARDEKDINANFYSGKITYPIGQDYSVAIGYDHYSGTDLSDDGNQKETNTFTNLYGPGHKYLGYMDYFSVASSHMSGINDLFGSVKTKLPWGINMILDVHQFSLDKEYAMIMVDGAKAIEKLDKNLGTEFDFTFKKKFDDQLTVQAGYSFMLATESMEALKLGKGIESDFPQFVYLMFNFTPEFFKSK